MLEARIWKRNLAMKLLSLAPRIARDGPMFDVLHTHTHERTNRIAARMH
jgi:hypothetical protein